MSQTETIFRFFVRTIFLFAYGAFLWASVHHIAYFYHNFEGTSDWTGPYALAISIDMTSLVLAVGLMFFSRNMAWHTMAGVSFFVLFLTAFSWLVNWEYAARFQSSGLTSDPWLHMLNPILASSFAFLNLAYSIVSGIFTARPKTAEELAKEADRLEALEEHQKRIAQYQERNKKPGVFRRIAATVKEAQEAANEVLKQPQNGALIESQNGSTVEEGSEVNQAFDVGQNIVRAAPYTPGKPEEQDLQNDDQLAFTSDVMKVLKSYPKVYLWLSKGQKTARIDEIAEVTGQSKRRITNRLNDGTLKRSSRNQQLILISSVMAWLKTAPIPGQTGEMPVIKVAAMNAHSSNGSDFA